MCREAGTDGLGSEDEGLILMYGEYGDPHGPTELIMMKMLRADWRSVRAIVTV